MLALAGTRPGSALARPLFATAALANTAEIRPQPVSQPAPRPDPTHSHICGSTTPGSLAWIDTPVFWINVDEAVDRAARMYAQLSLALLTGACATRVSAVLTADVSKVVTGSIFFPPGSELPGMLRFKSPSTRALEIAVMSSHLKAIAKAYQADPRSEAVFLVLEDDVDLAFYPSTHQWHPEWPISGMTTLSLARSQPSDWSFTLLMIITLPLRMRLLHEAWRTDGQATVVRAERVTGDARYGCPNKLWSAGAYLVRGSAAAETQRLWPTSEEDGHWRVNVSRTCWHLRTQLSVAKCSPIFNESEPAPNFVSDNCLLHAESFGPALTVEQAQALSKRSGSGRGGLPTGKDVIRLRAHISTRTYVATPPLIISHLLNADMAHPEDFLVHSRSMETVLNWWKHGTVPDCADDSAWLPQTGTSVPASAHRAATPIDAVGPLEKANVVNVFGPNSFLRTVADWRFGLPELRRGDLASTPFHCDELGGCRTPRVLPVQTITALGGLPNGWFNPALLPLLPEERLLLHRTHYLGVVQHGFGNQCTSQPLEANGTMVNGAARLNTIEVVFLDRDLKVVDHAPLFIEEEHCQGPKAIAHHCQLFRHASTRASPGEGLSAGGGGAAEAPADDGASEPWIRCVCQDWANDKGQYIKDLITPFVSPLKLARGAGGAMSATLPSGEGGLLFSASFPEGANKLARWYGGNGKTNQLLFSHKRELYALWDLSPFPTVVKLPTDGPGNELLAVQGDVRGRACCAQPLALRSKQGVVGLAGLNIGAAKALLHPAAGLVPVRLGNVTGLLGVARASRNLFGTHLHHAGKQHLPRSATHSTHLFFALEDTPPFALIKISAEFCLPRVGVGVSGGAITFGGATLDCNVIQTILSVVLDEEPPGGGAPQLLLSYGVDDCGSAVARILLGQAIAALHDLKTWQRFPGATHPVAANLTAAHPAAANLTPSTRAPLI